MATLGVFDSVFTQPNQESTDNGITATAGGTQATAYALTKAINRISTCATAADAVKLPASAVGLAITIINDGAKYAQIFGTSPDTINAVATATGVRLQAGKTATYRCTAAGIWKTTNSTTGLETNSVSNGLTATAGGAQAGTALTAGINRVTTVTTGADSVQLPAAVAGLQITVINAAAANAMAVFPQSGEIINALSADSSISVTANKTIMFHCAVAGTWNSLLTA